MIKVHILTRCKQCGGEAYLPIGETETYSSERYNRYLPCPRCNGSGNQANWVSLQDFLAMLAEVEAHDPMDPSHLRQDFRQILDCADLPKIRFHDLRHSAASLMLNHGVPINVVSNILGHSKVSVTLDIYAHTFTVNQEGVARLMDELVSPVKVTLVTTTLQEISPGEM